MALAKAFRWRQQLATGHRQTIPEIAAAEKTSRGHVSALLPLAFLCPDLIEAILEGRQSEQLTLSAIKRESVPLSWAEQRARFS